MTSPDDTSYLWEASPSFAENEHILAWWGERQAAAVAQAIEEMAWMYPWRLHESIVAVTPEDVITQWRSQDPACQRYAWYNVLIYFGVAWARQSGLEDEMVAPATLDCLRCSKRFRQDEVVASIARKVGRFSEIKYCRRCYESAFVGGTDLDDLKLSDDDIAAWFREVAELTGVIPTAGFFRDARYLESVNDAKARAKLLTLAAKRPTDQRIKKSFGSWLNALVMAGLLPGGLQKARLGIRSVAADGHVCLSVAERIIDDWLTAYGIEHEKEPHYPGSNFRGDWGVGGSFIEFFGLAGDPAYDARILQKRELATTHGIDLIEIYPEDMLAWAATQESLAKRLGFELHARKRRTLPTKPKRLSVEKPTRPEPPPEGPEEGWYPDPTDREASRWWDGRYWTQWVQGESEEPYSDTPFPDRDDPTNSGPTIEGLPTWEFLSTTKFPWPGKLKEPELSIHLQRMFRCMDAVENDAGSNVGGTSPAAYSEAAGHLRSIGSLAGEAAVLTRAVNGGLGSGSGRRDIKARLSALEDAGIHPNPIEAGMSAGYPPPSD